MTRTDRPSRAAVAQPKEYPTMTPRTGFRRRSGRNGEHGQMVVLFALCLIAIIAMAGLLIDGGMAWANRRQAQAAADTAALAAAKAIVANADGTAAAQLVAGTAAAQAVAGANRFGAGTDCAGNALLNNGVTVNRPPSAQADPAHQTTGYVEVVTTRAMHTTFAAAVGQGCWMVSARAVASIASSSVASCSFCSLNDSSDAHTLLLQNGATLRVDGDIYANSSNGGTGPGCTLNQWKVCGDGFDVFGAGGSISARTISAVGGWETHDLNIATADALAQVGSPAVDCSQHPDPPSQFATTGITSNVCIHMPVIADPLNDPAHPGNVITPPSVLSQTVPVAGANGCPIDARVPSAATGVLADITAGSATICPGKYVGGITIKNGASVTMMPGVYYMLGGGFQALNASSLDGSAGVMIYNTSGAASGDSTNPGVDLVPVCDPSLPSTCRTPGGIQLSSTDNSPTPGQSVTLKMVVDKGGGSNASPTGTVTFFDGQTAIASCSNVVLVTGGGTKMQALCNISWPIWGSHHISAIYSGDAVYKAVGDTVTITIASPAGTGAGAVTIDTTGNVKLVGPKSGSYSGLTIFQDRSTTNTVTLAPGTGLPACTGSWLTADVPHVVDPLGFPPLPCGPLGGISGTIYAPANDSLVLIQASGLADLQVISGKIQINTDVNTRFAYTPSLFANGKIHLVE